MTVPAAIKELEKILGKKNADLSTTYIFWIRVLEELNYNEELDNLGNLFDTVILLE